MAATALGVMNPLPVPFISGTQSGFTSFAMVTNTLSDDLGPKDTARYFVHSGTLPAGMSLDTASGNLNYAGSPTVPVGFQVSHSLPPPLPADSLVQGKDRGWSQG